MKWIKLECDVDGNFNCPMPKEYEQFLLCFEDGTIIIDMLLEDGDGLYLDSGYSWVNTIAWMPLPKPFKEDINND